MTPQTTTNAANWRKSSYSADQTACVEVADWEMGATIRDTQNRELGQLGFPTQAWVSFLTEVKAGRL